MDHLEADASLATLPQLDPSARAGESLIFLNIGELLLTTNNSLVVINQANNQEIRRIGELRQVTLTTYRGGLPDEHLGRGGDAGFLLTTLP